MREHPVPQDITGYKFHIIGSMTIKQFAMVAGGVVLAFLVNMTNLPVFLKWPIMAVLAGVGALAAFVPIEEQPLDHWITTFFKVLYKPTQYYWRREAKTPEAFEYEQKTKISETDVPADLSPARKERIKEYLFSLNAPQVDEYDLYEQSRADALTQSFSGNKQTPTLAPAPKASEEKKPLAVPQQKATKIDEGVKKSQIPRTQATLESTKPQAPVFSQTQKDSSQVASQTTTTTHNAQLPFPSKATIPNKIVGMVLSSNSELINDAIVEIKSESGQVLRAVKSNSLGQFFVSTPLKDGNYLISAEKNGFSFEQSRLILEGKIIDPIEIKSI